MVSQLKKSVKKSSKRRMQQKPRRMFTTANVLIAIVALIECFILLSFTTYSWIESTSSLVIATGEDANGQNIGSVSMDVADELNYQVNIAADAAQPADMTTFYRTVKYFRFAKASSANGVDFYFPKANAVNTSISNKYRAGDTADYNISYTYFDFKLTNTSGSRKEFYFKSGVTLFNATTEEGETALSSTITNNIKKAMRISFKQDSAAAKIYSLESTQTTGVVSGLSDTAGTPTTTNVTPTAVSYSTYTDGIASDKAIFAIEPNAPESTVSIRIWLEEKALSNDAKAALYKSKVEVDLQLVSDNIKYDQIYFDDYTLSSETGHLGEFTTETGQSLYFWAYNSNVQKYIAYPMSLTTNEDDASIPRYVTSCPVYYVFKNLTSSNTYYNNCFFGYGALPDSGASATPNQTPVYKWKLPSTLSVTSSSASDQNGAITGNKYVRAIGLAKASASPTTTTGFSVWRNTSDVPVELIVQDYTTAYTTLGYNESGTVNSNPVTNEKFLNDSAIVESTGARNLYLYVAGADDSPSTSAVSFYYDEPHEYFRCYVPSSWISGSSMKIRYNTDGYYNTSSKVIWSPGSHAIGTDTVFTYTALGYSGSGLVTAASNATGYGTWGGVRSVSFSTELIDSTIASGNIYRVSADDSSYVPMIPDASDLTFTAYIPDTATNVYFKRTVSSTNTTWSSAITDADSVFYPVSNSAGYFHISVLVDATYNHLITDIFDDPYETGYPPTLTAAIDSGAAADISAQKIDDYRWYVPCTASTGMVTYTWTPYPKTSTQFVYQHYLADGIYYIVTE